MHKIVYRIKVLRLISLPLSLSGVVMGGLLANAQGHFSWLILGLALVTAAALHLTCNLANDVGDYLSGNDSFESIGYETMLPAGKLSVKEVVFMMIVLAVVAVIAGIALVYFALGTLFSLPSLIMIFTGLLALCAAIFYTIGKKPYGYRALGDLAVFIFFGLVAVAGTFFLLTESLPPILFIPAASMGCLITGVVNLNNIRDMENDKKYRKTVPVLIGEKNAKYYHAFLVFTPFVLMWIFDYIYDKPFSAIFLLFLFPFVVYHYRRMVQLRGLALNKPLGGLILLTVLFVLSAL